MMETTGVDIFGGPSSNVAKYALFHDESFCEIDKFLYHGYLLVKISEGRRILKDLLGIKERYYDSNKEIHYNEIRNRSNRKHGEKAKVAVNWLERAKKWLSLGQIKFYLLGINKNNLKNFWDNEKSYEFNVYTRFFEIGLKSTVRWFAEGDIKRGKELWVTHLYFDPRDRYSNLGRKEKTIMVSSLLKTERKAGAIKTDEISLLDSDSRISGSSISNYIQLVDVLCGVCRTSFVRIAKSSAGQQECVDEFIDVVEQFNCSEKAYITNATYYKKFAMQFFPTESDLTFQEFTSRGFVPRKSNFYCDRPTFRQAEELKKQQSLF